MNTKTNKLLALLMSLALMLALLTGCGQETETADSASSDTAASTSEEASAEDAATEDASTEDATAEDAATEETAETADAEAETKEITLTVTYSDETSDEYTIETTAEYLMEAIEETVELGGTESEYGFYIDSVNGQAADYDADGAYWAIYVNDEYGSYSIDSQPVTDGDHYALVYTVA